MKIDPHLKDQLLDELRGFVEQIKLEVLLQQRSDDEYPLSIGSAATYLADVFQLIASQTEDADRSSRQASKLSRESVLGFLKSDKWEQDRVGRKKYKNGPGYSYKFFVPGDEHFMEMPESEIQYVKLLLELERRRQPVASDKTVKQKEPPPQIEESFEAVVRRCYRQLLGMSRGGSYVRIPELFRLTGVSKEKFQTGLMDMRDKGEAILSKHGYAASLSPADMVDSIEVSPGEFFYYLTLRED